MTPRFSDRKAMLYSAAFLGTGTMLGILIAGMVSPELAPPNQWKWQISYGSVAVVCIVSQLTWMRRLDDVRVYWAANFWCSLQIILPVGLMVANRQSIAALYISLLAPAAFAAHFFRRREVVAQTTLITIAIATPLAAHASDLAGWHMLSRIVAFLPIMWVCVVAVWLLRRNRQSALDEAEQSAMTDPLTGLANLRAFGQRAEELLDERNARLTGDTGLLLIDLDHFKDANSLYGHAGGDHLLQTVGASLARAASDDHLVARIGGDEFAVLLAHATAGDIADQAIRYRKAVLSSQRVAEMPGIAVDASVGTAIASRDGDDLGDLMTAADRSMYAVKASPEHVRPGRNGIADSSLPDVSARRRATAKWVLASSSDVDGEVAESKSTRPENAKFAALTWAIGVTIGLISLAMPDADHQYVGLATLALLCGYLVAVIAYFTAPPVEHPRHVFNDLFTLSGIAVIAYLTGGADSPLWPLVFLFIAYEAWYLGWKRITLRALGPVVVILLPLTYETGGEISRADGAAMYSGVLVALGLTFLLSYNQVNMQRAQRRARMQATIDARTGLANRREFERQVEIAFAARGVNSNETPAIVMLDLDNFKSVNSAHGHAAGDELLRAIAAELAASTRTGDCIARVGGDEFAVVLPAADAESARRVSERYVSAVSRATSTSSLEACRAVSASAGFALFGDHGQTFDELIRAADTALMAAKADRLDASTGGVVVTPG